MGNDLVDFVEQVDGSVKICLWPGVLAANKSAIEAVIKHHMTNHKVSVNCKRGVVTVQERARRR